MPRQTRPVARPRSARGSEPAALELRLLGELELRRDGTVVPLPQSKKTRGLLAYLALTGRSHRRQRLCSLLWDVPDDPRGALRWSLSKLRPLVDDPGRPRLAADRESVSLELAGMRVDVLAVRERTASGIEALATEELEAIAGEFRGELVEGLDLGDFLEFQAWCGAEREHTRLLHAAIRAALATRLAPEPERALPHARAWTQVDPLDADAATMLLRLLDAAGRRREADAYHHSARRMFEELGADVAALDATWQRLRAGGESKSPVPPAPSASAETSEDAPSGGGRAPPDRPYRGARAARRGRARRRNPRSATRRRGPGRARRRQDLPGRRSARRDAPRWWQRDRGARLRGRIGPALRSVDRRYPPTSATPGRDHARRRAGAARARARGRYHRGIEPRAALRRRRRAAGGARAQRAARRGRDRRRPLARRGVGRAAALRRSYEPPPSDPGRPGGAGR